MADFRSRQRVQIHDGTDEFGVLSSKPIFVNVGDGTNQLSLDGSGNLNVNIVGGATSGTEFNEDAAHTTGDAGTQILAVRNDTLASLVDADGDYAPFQVDASGALYVNISNSVISIDDNGGSITVDGTVAATQSGTWNIDTVTTLTSITNDVNIADGGNSITVDDGGTTLSIDDGGASITVDATALDIRALTNADVVTVEQTTHDSLNANANLQVGDADVSASNPVPVNIVDQVSSAEVNDYNTTASVAKDASTNHDYTVSGGTTLLIKEVIVAASGAMRADLIVNSVTKMTIFTTGSKLTEAITFPKPIEAAAGQVVRITLRNDDNSTMDVFSTLIGEEV